jgi:kynureninase
MLAPHRDEFPMLAECVYLNSNSTGAFPRGVKQFLDAYWEHTLSVWRDMHWGWWWDAMLAYADQIAAFLGAPPKSVVTDVNLSSLMGRLGTCFDFVAPRKRIVTTDMDFPTVRFLWKAFERYGAEVVVVPVRRPGAIDHEALLAAVDERTLLCAVSHASYQDGALLDVARVTRHCHAVGTLVLLDAYQSVGTVPIDVTALDVDFLGGGAHKWLCGSTETAFLYVRPSLVGDLRPAATGWVGSDDPLEFEEPVRYADGARRFATGTPQILPGLLSRVGMELLTDVGMDEVRRLSLRRTARIMARADAAGIRVLTPRADAERGGVVGLDLPKSVAEQMNARRFICSHRGALRIAPHYYNTDDEVERFMDQLEALA